MIVSPSMDKLARKAKVAAASGATDYFSSAQDRVYQRRCTHIHVQSETSIVFTRDYGHHSCGWIKNPDFEYCFHLSLAFRDRETGERRPQDKKAAEKWCQLFFGHYRRWLWIESPKSPEGRIADVWHYRLFCDQAWQPIFPRGEVYSTELTEAGWKSWSELHPNTPPPKVPTSMTPDGGNV